LTGPEAFAAVNLDTLALLFGTMIMAALLEREGFFRNVQKLWCLRIPNGGGRAAHHLLFRVVLSSGLLSALFTNDSWCVVGTPVLLRLCARFRLPYAPFLLALATSANIGSACSPVGNPQNMLIASASGLSFTTFLKFLLLPTIICLLLNALALMLVYNTQLHGHTIMWTEAPRNRSMGALLVVQALLQEAPVASPSISMTTIPLARCGIDVHLALAVPYAGATLETRAAWVTALVTELCACAS
jgi:Na+/H+ antiporter NhaD/arsenite permease-like protein